MKLSIPSSMIARRLITTPNTESVLLAPKTYPDSGLFCLTAHFHVDRDDGDLSDRIKSINEIRCGIS